MSVFSGFFSYGIGICLLSAAISGKVTTLDNRPFTSTQHATLALMGCSLILFGGVLAIG